MWIPLAFIVALTDSAQNAFFKKAHLRVNPILLAWSVLVVSGLLYSPLLLRGIPELSTTFWVTVVIRLAFDSAAFVLYIKGVQEAPLTLTVPMAAVGTLVLVVVSGIINHLVPSPVGMVGIALSAAGVYLLNFDHDTKHLLSPFKAIINNRGVRYVTIAMLLWTVVSSVQKLAIDQSNYLFYTAAFQLMWATIMTPVAFFYNRAQFRQVFQFRTAWKLAIGGSLEAIKMLAHNAAYSLTLPAYVNSVSNTSIVFSSLIGFWFFKEKLHQHWLPIGLIFVGITLMTLGG